MQIYFFSCAVLYAANLTSMNFDDLQEKYLSLAYSKLQNPKNADESAVLKKELAISINFLMDVFPLQIPKKQKPTQTVYGYVTGSQDLKKSTSGSIPSSDIAETTTCG